jgi:NhaA family Na+:H+ antiporter
VPRRVVRPLQEFLQASTSGGLVLVAAAIVALVWANSPAADTYERLWRNDVSIGVGGWSLEEPLRFWVDDGLMALFFLVVGLEIKREFVIGELRELRAAILPVVAAVAGMVLPAVVYLSINAGHIGSRGWAIAMPTDIAFTLGILALATRKAPPGLKAFILGLAIVDDILTIVVLALFFRTGVKLGPLLLVALLAAAMFLLERVDIRATVVYAGLGIVMWLAMNAAGVEPALTGVIVGLLTPAFPFRRPRHVSEEAIRVADETTDDPEPPDADAHWWLLLATLSREAVSPLARIEHFLLPWTTLAVLPLFALANAGVHLSVGALPEQLTSSIAIGIVLGHVGGKILGIGAGSWFVVRIGAARLPDGTRLPQIFSVATAGGIAFTVSLYVAGVAFKGSPELIEQAKVGILASGLIAGPLGYVLLRATTRR